MPVWSADAGNRRVQLAPKVSLFQNPCHGTPHCDPGRGWLAIDRMSVSLAPPAPAAWQVAADVVLFAADCLAHRPTGLVAKLNSIHRISHTTLVWWDHPGSINISTVSSRLASSDSTQYGSRLACRDKCVTMLCKIKFELFLTDMHPGLQVHDEEKALPRAAGPETPSGLVPAGYAAVQDGVRFCSVWSARAAFDH